MGWKLFYPNVLLILLKEYMENAKNKWDKRQRINQMLQVYLGAEDKELISKIATMWLVGAVAKVYDPYVKFDYVLDLVGGQGVGKTSFLQKNRRSMVYRCCN